MENIKMKGLRIGNWILSGALGLLGFSSCGDDGGGGACEYGTPYAKYEIKGKVTNQDKAAMPNARIIVKELGQDGKVISYHANADTVLTDQSGSYLREYSATNYGKYRVVCEDPQDAYKADSTDIQMKPTGGSGWYEGSDSKVVDFELKKKD